MDFFDRQFEQKSFRFYVQSERITASKDNNYALNDLHSVRKLSNRFLSNEYSDVLELKQSEY